jgi:hypothetical protein
MKREEYPSANVVEMAWRISIVINGRNGVNGETRRGAKA